MKCLERIVLRNLIGPIRSSIDPLQFAYQPQRCANDAVLSFVHTLQEHLDTPRRYARALFVDFSSAFNTIQPHRLIEKLLHLKVKPSLILWITDFLLTRSQRVRVNNILSEPLHTNTGSPQGCVLSPIIFILYTNDCLSHFNNVHTFKYADDTAILGLIKYDEKDYRDCVDNFNSRCVENYLELNVQKTKEILFDFRIKVESKPSDHPVSIKGQDIEIVTSYKYLGTNIDNELVWNGHTKALATKGSQRMHFLRKLRSYHVDRTILSLLYRSVVESIMTYDSVVWYNSARKKDQGKLKTIVKQAAKIIDRPMDLDDVCRNRAVETAVKLSRDSSHPLNGNYVRLRSGKRWQSKKSRTSRYLNSYVPYSIRLLNEI